MQRALILLIGVLATTGAFLFAPPCAYAQDFSGEDRYDTARLEAQEAYPNGSSSVVLACGEGWADALSATSLAGALRAPLLFTPTASLSTHTVAGIESLGCSNVIIIGNQNSVSNAVEQQIKKFPEVKSTIRLGGESRIDTQMAIYQYGLDKKLWTSERIIVANAWNFADALTASPLAYRYASPLFLVSDYFTPEQEEALIALMPTQIAVMGGSTAVCDYTYGFLQALATYSTGDESELFRFSGETRYETNAQFAQWAVSKGYLSWDRVAVTRSDAPYDALAGAALQGNRSSVLLMASHKDDPTVRTLIRQKGNVSDVSFFGGEVSISTSLRNYIKSYLGLYIGSASVKTSCLMQYPELPTGCEALALTNALSAYGHYLNKFMIVDHYLPYSSYDFVTAYNGNPYTSGGAWNSCCAPAIVRAANSYLYASGSSLQAYEITGTSLSTLYTYIERGYPVIAWTTIDQTPPSIIWTSQWYNNHRYGLWDSTHTVVLNGFDREVGTVSIADSIAGSFTTSESTFNWIWSTTGAQAVVII